MDDRAAVAMRLDDAGWWSATVPLALGLHGIEAVGDGDRALIDLLVGGKKEIPRPSAAIMLGCDVHAIARRAEHGAAGTQRGADKNGKHR